MLLINDDLYEYNTYYCSEDWWYVDRYNRIINQDLYEFSYDGMPLMDPYDDAIYTVEIE